MAASGERKCWEGRERLRILAASHYFLQPRTQLQPARVAVMCGERQEQLARYFKRSLASKFRSHVSESYKNLNCGHPIWDTGRWVVIKNVRFLEGTSRDRLLRLKFGQLFLSPQWRLSEVCDCGLDVRVPCLVSHCSRPAIKLTFPLV